MSYHLTTAAEQDVRGLLRYSREQFGITQARRYGEGLEAHFIGLGDGTTVARLFSDRLPDVMVSRYQSHFVFHMIDAEDLILILAVLHQRMDLMTRLQDRLDL